MVEKIEETPAEKAARAARAAAHAVWLKQQQAIDLHDSRIELVRRYLNNPSQWPDGIDWPDWEQPHELWYTGKEAYWHPLAKALQARLDTAKDVLKQAEKAAGVTPVTVTDTPKPVDTPPVHIVHEPVHQTVHKPNPVDIVDTPVDTTVDSVVNSSLSTETTPEDRRKAYKREWMAKRRAADKASGTTAGSSHP